MGSRAHRILQMVRRESDEDQKTDDHNLPTAVIINAHRDHQVQSNGSCDSDSIPDSQHSLDLSCSQDTDEYFISEYTPNRPNIVIDESDSESYSDSDPSSSTSDSTSDFSSDDSVKDPNFQIEATASDSDSDENLPSQPGPSRRLTKILSRSHSAESPRFKIQPLSINIITQPPSEGIDCQPTSVDNNSQLSNIDSVPASVDSQSLILDTPPSIGRKKKSKSNNMEEKCSQEVEK